MGFIAAYARERRMYAGYSDLQPDVQALRKKIGGEVFRDGEDLVISGTDSKWPVVIRFSYSETTPGLHVRVAAPSTLDLSVLPKNGPFVIPDKRIAVTTQDDNFNARFALRTTDGAAARMFLTGRDIGSELQRACCSSRTMVQISKGSLELIETTVPSNAARHVAAHIDSLVKMANLLAQMPGAAQIRVQRPKRERHIFRRFVIATGVVAAIAAVLMAVRPEPQQSARAAAPVRHRNVVPLRDAENIPGVSGFHVLDAEEVDAKTVGVLKAMGSEVQGGLNLDYTGGQAAKDVAYMLVNDKGQHRFVVLSGGRALIDDYFNGQPVIAVVRRGIFPTIEWAERSPAPAPDGDAILMIRDRDDNRSGAIFYQSGGRTISRPVKDWRSINLR